jgi:hypothetical protein
MKLSLRTILAAAASAFLAAGIPGVANASTPGWRVVKIGHTKNAFYAVAATGSRDAWAYGSSGLERWNGKDWRPVADRNAPNGMAASPLIAASKADNVWVAFADPNGPFYPSGAAPQLAHWNGKIWTKALAPDVIIIDALATTGPKDAWEFGRDSSYKALAEHFDGKRWRRIPIPGYVTRVSALSPRDIWAVGTASLSDPGYQEDVVFHWDGHLWRTFSLAKQVAPGKMIAQESAILASAPNSVWMTTALTKDGLSVPNPVLLHWNGRKWTRITGANPKDSFTNMISDGAGGLWLASDVHNASWLVHYTPGTWTRQAAPAPHGWQPVVRGLALIPGTRSVWGVGALNNGNVTGQEAIFKYGS